MKMGVNYVNIVRLEPLKYFFDAFSDVLPVC